MLKQTILATTLTVSMIAAAWASDNNCFDTKTFNTVTKQCQCILSNTLTNCKASKTPKVFCNKVAINDLFRADPSLAIAKCEQFTTDDHKKECPVSIGFYRTNSCWNKT